MALRRNAQLTMKGIPQMDVRLSIKCFLCDLNDLESNHTPAMNKVSTKTGSATLSAEEATMNCLHWVRDSTLKIMGSHYFYRFIMLVLYLNSGLLVKCIILVAPIDNNAIISVYMFLSYGISRMRLQ